jgi:hypothetical protein
LTPTAPPLVVVAHPASASNQMLIDTDVTTRKANTFPP